jgi:branched-chain amino acid transport system permease protein
VIAGPRAQHLLLAAAGAALLAYPWLLNPFWVLQIGGRTLGFGTVALSLVFLSAYAGMLSLAQLAVAGVAGYALAYFSAPMGSVGIALGWPAAVAVALALATLAGLLVGALSARTEGIYTLMLTLAVAMGFYALALQNYAVFNGWTGFTQVSTPALLGGGRPIPFYYLSLACAASCYALARYLTRTPFGLALQATRDNARRLRALGTPTTLPRVAAFGIAGFMAGVGGVLNTWLNGSISPGSIALTPTVDVLIAAVLGGMSGPIGAYLGAFLFTVIQSFAITVVPPERFNTLIGAIFIAVVVLSPNGALGLARGLARGRTIPRANRAAAPHAAPRTAPAGASGGGGSNHVQ